MTIYTLQIKIIRFKFPNCVVYWNTLLFYQLPMVQVLFNTTSIKNYVLGYSRTTTTTTYK